MSFINIGYPVDSKGRFVKPINWKSYGGLDVYVSGRGTFTVIENMIELSTAVDPCLWIGEAVLSDWRRGLGTGQGTWEKVGKIFGQLTVKGRTSGGKSGCPRANEPSTKTLIFSIYSRD